MKPLPCLLCACFVAALFLARPAVSADPVLNLNLRSLVKARGGDEFREVETKAAWVPRKTALIVCDMWDDHWCKSAAPGGRAGRAHERHDPHGTRPGRVHYPCSQQRHLFLQGHAAAPTRPERTHGTDPRAAGHGRAWGTAWCWTEGKREGVLPIDDSDMGCDCVVKCTIREAWKRQIATIEIAEADAITDNGQETWNLLQQRGIDNVILCGVHLNMCVLGRPFGIRQMVKLGKNVALIRDMTDTMYCPDRPPGVGHFQGTDLMVKHVEKFWCPSFQSSDITGKPAFRFKADPRARPRDNDPK